MPSLRRVLSLCSLLTIAGALTGLGLLATARAASAEIAGGCTATLNGVNVASLDSGNRTNDIRVDQQATIPVVFTTTSGFASHQLQIEFAGLGWPISQKSDNGAKQFTERANVAQYAKHGVGLYKVIGVATLSDGSTCSGAATVDVAGNPMDTTAGKVAAGAVAVGTVMSLASTVVSASAGPGDVSSSHPARPGEAMAEYWRRRNEEEWADRRRYLSFGCLTLLPVVMLMTWLMFPVAVLGDDGSGGQPAPARARAGLRITVLGLGSGLLAGLGVAVLLQQYSIAYPTGTLLATVLAAGAVLYGVVLPTIARSIRAGRINRRIEASEQSR